MIWWHLIVAASLFPSYWFSRGTVGGRDLDYVKATVVVVDVNRRSRTATKVLEDSGEIRRLLNFFPHVGEGLDSGVTSPWAAGVKITLRRQDGSELQILVDDEMTVWHEGKGERRVRSGLREYIRKLFAGAEFSK